MLPLPDAFCALVESVGERRRGGLVDDSQDIQAGNAPSVFGGLALRVVEVGRAGDDGLRNLLAEVVLGGLLHLAQHHRGDLGRAVPLAAQLDPGVAVLGRDDLVSRDPDAFFHLGRIELAADQPLDREDRVLRIGDGLALGNLAHQPLTRLGERHHRRRGATAFRIRDHHRLAAFHDGDAGVGGAEIDADHLGHCSERSPGDA